MLDLHYLLEHLSDDPFFKKYKKLNKALIEIVEDYGLVSFVPLNIQVCGTLSSDSDCFPHLFLSLSVCVGQGECDAGCQGSGQG